jgi:hypothetical protein
MRHSQYSAAARVAVREADQRAQCAGVEPDMEQCPRQGAVDQNPHVAVVERLEHVDLQSGQQGRLQDKGRILGGRADQDDVGRLRGRQQRLLLLWTAAVDFVDKQDGAFCQR